MLVVKSPQVATMAVWGIVGIFRRAFNAVVVGVGHSGTTNPNCGISTPAKERPMTGTPDDLPSPDEYVRRMAHVDEEFADA
jgi:hypothetical protein